MNPDDLERIYGSIDLNYVVYGGDPKSEIGVRLAIPNKLYESIFFQVPLVCREKIRRSALLQGSLGWVLLFPRTRLSKTSLKSIEPRLI